MRIDTPPNNPCNETRHIVDELIEERAHRLRRHPLLWKLITNTLYPILDYQRTKDMVDVIAPMNGMQVFNYLSGMLDLSIEVSGVEQIPTTGGAMLIANHPGGIADGVAVFDAIKTRRTDVSFFANRDALRISPEMIDHIIPVEWIEEKRTRQRQKETVKRMVSAFREDRLVVIFPSGRLAYLTWAGLTERPWQPTAVSLAQKYQCPIIPMHIKARNSLLFYMLSLISDELRDMTLFHELLNKTNHPYKMQIGSSIEPNGDINALTQALQEYVTQDLANGNTVFTNTLCTTDETSPESAHA